MSIFSRATENGPAVCECLCVQRSTALFSQSPFCSTDFFHWAVVVSVLLSSLCIGLQTHISQELVDHELMGGTDMNTSASVNIDDDVSLSLITTASYSVVFLFTAEVLMKMLAYANPWQNWRWLRQVWDIFDVLVCAVRTRSTACGAASFVAVLLL